MSRIHNRRSDELGVGGINGSEKETNTGRGAAEQSGEERSGPSRKTSFNQSVRRGGAGITASVQYFSRHRECVCAKDG